MKIFVESKNVWKQCGLITEADVSIVSKIFYFIHFILILSSQGLYFVLSVLYIAIYFAETDIIHLLYIGLQSQMAFLALSSFFCLHLQRQNITKMIEKIQKLVDERNNTINNIVSEAIHFIYIHSLGSKDVKLNEIYEYAEWKTALISKWPIFASYYYMLIQTCSIAIYLILDCFRGHIDTTKYYYIATI